MPQRFIMRKVLLLLSLAVGSLLLTSFAAAQNRLATLAGDGSVILHSPDGEVLVSYNPNSSLLPASLLKIPLAQVAFRTLTEDFRFATHIYLNEHGDMLIRGVGDPLLVSEEVANIAGKLKQMGLTQVRRLIVDDSAFASNLDLPVEPGTDQPYGARNAALAVNFNTVNLDWDANGELVSAEQQTPLTDVARELGAGLRPGQEQRINLGSDPIMGLMQAQQLFHFFLTEAGVEVIDSDFYREEVSPDWALFYAHRSSRPLRDVLDGMLRYSNNFIANQLFLLIGAQVGGLPATVESARGALRDQLESLYGDGFGYDPNTLLMLEGSGLSREQRTSGAGFMRVLEVFKPRAELLPEVRGVLRKSGTLTGVYNYAGYIRGSDGLHPFVILTNQPANNRDAILRILRDEVN